MKIQYHMYQWYVKKNVIKLLLLYFFRRIYIINYTNIYIIIYYIEIIQKN